MSRRKRMVESSSSSDNEDESEDEYVPSSSRRGGKRPHQQGGASSVLTQAVESQLASQCIELSQEEFARSAGLVANYFLAADCRKVPVKRAELIKVVGKQHVRRLPPIIQECSALLQKIYGYKVEELKGKKNTYLLVNILAAPINTITISLSRCSNGVGDSSEDSSEDRLEEGDSKEQEDEKQALLLVVLSVVFMMGGVVEEVTLHSFLKCLGVYVDSKDPHPLYGNVRKQMEEYIRQCYLEVNVLKDMEPPSKQYSWGERADLQVCKRSILEFVCKVYGGGMRPQSWVDHWSKLSGSTDTATSSNGSSVEELIVLDANHHAAAAAAAAPRNAARKTKA